MTVLGDLDTANKALQADKSAAHATKVFAAAATAAIHALTPAPAPTPTPAPKAAGGIGLYALGGSLAKCSHLTDGTYTVVIGDWDDTALLRSTSGESYVYTVTTSGVTPGTEGEYVILDANPNGGTIPNSLTPSQYAAKCIAYLAANPGIDGVFLDNSLSTITGLADALKTVRAQFSAHGVKLAANVGGYIAGNPGSDDGTLWRSWARTVEPFLDRIMLENWQCTSTDPSKLRVRGPGWDQHWDEWQLCPAVAGDKFLAVTYLDTAAAVYGRASMLTAPGVTPGAVFVHQTGSDPYDPAWAKPNPKPTVNPAAPGSATL